LLGVFVGYLVSCGLALCRGVVPALHSGPDKNLPAIEPTAERPQDAEDEEA
jgi:hypothetical protein